MFDNFDVYFPQEIERRGWKSLIYGTGMPFFVEDLVREFYEGIQDFDIGNGVLRVLLERQMHRVDLNLIADVVGIPVRNGPNPHLQIVEYTSLMGPACRIPNDAGIMASTCYRNIIAAGRWIGTNITGTTKTSAFYAPTLACGCVDE
jgi:hypothetical protein